MIFTSIQNVHGKGGLVGESEVTDPFFFFKNNITKDDDFLLTVIFFNIFQFSGRGLMT